METLILFFISALPIVLLGIFIYKKDKNKEPGKLLLKLFIGGILSCFLVVILDSILCGLFPIFKAEYNELNLLGLILYAFIKVALVEEFCKWLITYNTSYNNKNFDEIFDIIVYSVFVALGFAFFENVLYVFDGGIKTGIIRAITAVPGHACDAVFMGYYLGLAKLSSLNNDNKSRNKYMILSILIPTILHGIYDYCLFTMNIIFFGIFIIFVIILFITTFKRIKKMSSINRKMIYNQNYCSVCGQVVNSNYCANCGTKRN